MGKVSFFFEETLFKINNKKILVDWITTICKSYNMHIVSLNYIFCNDAYLLSINKEYLGHDFFTDIVTFDLRENPYSETNTIESDIFISIDRVMENASTNKVSFENEICRVLCHGLLHLAGMQDKTIAQKRGMRAAEEACMAYFPKYNKALFHVEQKA